MEITFEEAHAMIQARFTAYPRVNAIVMAPQFKDELKNILELEKIDVTLLPIIEYELYIVLAFYAPLSDLAPNIADATGLHDDVAENLVTLIDAVFLSPIRDELYTFEYIWEVELEKALQVPEAPKETREKLELRPTGAMVREGIHQYGEGSSKPLTREEVMRALAPKRTMAGDIQSMKESTAQTGDTAQQKNINGEESAK